VDEILLVSEAEIERAVFTTLKECHLVVEPSAAAAVAALEKLHPRKDSKIVVVVSGGNVSLKLLHTVLSKYSQFLNPI
jgi:threonine dehydratase